jgi:hypothetical protein
MFLYTWQKTGMILTITECLAGGHRRFNKRAVDVRSKDLPGSDYVGVTHVPETAFAYELRDWINGRYCYGRRNKKTGNFYPVVVFGNNDPKRKHEDHFHIQAPPPLRIVNKPLWLTG